jgi:hypothetical protein
MKWINTKVEFTWDSKKQKYIETDVQGYHYSGTIAQCGGGGESFGAGELVSISGSLEGIPHVSMSVGDVVLSANITGLPDSDVAAEFLLWTYSGSFDSFVGVGGLNSSQVSLTSSLVESITTHSRAPNDSGMWKIICENGRTDDILVTEAHPFLVYSGSTDEGQQGAWYFEYAEEITSDMKLFSSSLEPVDITSVTNVTSSTSESFFRFDIEPYDVYFVEGILVHN